MDGDYISSAAFWNASIVDAYPEGGMYVAGNLEQSDLWFKTGYVIPEPSSLALLGLGGAWLLLARRKRRTGNRVPRFAG